MGRSSTRRSCSASTRRSVFNVDLTGDVFVFIFVFPREGVCSMSTSQMMYLYWSSLILCLVSSRSSNNGMFRCEFCGQGFIVAARLKHHRRNCQVLINKLLKSSKSQYQLIIVCNPTGKSSPNDSCLQGGFTFCYIYISAYLSKVFIFYI